jgi:hypothetical protein
MAAYLAVELRVLHSLHGLLLYSPHGLLLYSLHGLLLYSLHGLLLYSPHGLLSKKYSYSYSPPSQPVKLLYGLLLPYPAIRLFSVSFGTKWQFPLFTVSLHHVSN